MVDSKYEATTCLCFFHPKAPGCWQTRTAIPYSEKGSSRAILSIPNADCTPRSAKILPYHVCNISSIGNSWELGGWILTKKGSQAIVGGRNGEQHAFYIQSLSAKARV